MPRAEDLAARIEALLPGRERVVIGIAGPPGSGKSTIAEAVRGELVGRGVPAVQVPMDGFHLADVQLRRLGRLERKGAADTFDAWGYLALLRRLRRETGNPVYAPAFERTTEEPLAGAVAVDPGCRVVLTEGNYLLDDEAPWADVAAELTETWYCDAPDDVRRERLVLRHVRFGKTPEHARRWVDDVDEANARRTVAGRARADLIVPTAPTRSDPNDPARPGRPERPARPERS